MKLRNKVTKSGASICYLVSKSVKKNKAVLETLINVVLLLLHFIQCAFQTSEYYNNKQIHIHETPLKAH